VLPRNGVEAALAKGIVEAGDLDGFLRELRHTAQNKFEANPLLRARLWEYAVDSKGLVGRKSGWTFNERVQHNGYTLVLAFRRDKEKNETTDDKFSMFYPDMAKAPGEAEFQAWLAGLGWSIVYQQADGNSLFRSFGHQLNGDPDQHARIRTRTVGFMTKRGRQAFEPLSNHLSEEAWVSHLKQMGNAGTPSKTPGTCGSFLEVLALAHTYKKYVVVHQYQQPPLIFPSPQSTRKWGFVHVSFHGGDWWGSIQFDARSSGAVK
jgi:hypothetical protein